MKKTKYYVYLSSIVSYVYVTTTRNREDMIGMIRQINESPDNRRFRIEVIEDGLRKVVYSKTNNGYKKWSSLLENFTTQNLP